MGALDHNRLASIVGVLIGLAIVPVAFLLAPVSRGGTIIGLDLSLNALPTPEVALEPGPLGRGTQMGPGDVVGGQKVVRNQTGRTLIVSVRARPTADRLDDVLRLRVRVDGLPVFLGSLRELRSWTVRWFQLERGERRLLQVDAQLPPGLAADAYQGQIEDVAVELFPRVRP